MTPEPSWIASGSESSSISALSDAPGDGQLGRRRPELGLRLVGRVGHGRQVGAGRGEPAGQPDGGEHRTDRERAEQGPDPARRRRPDGSARPREPSKALVQGRAEPSPAIETSRSESGAGARRRAPLRPRRSRTARSSATSARQPGAAEQVA